MLDVKMSWSASTTSEPPHFRHNVGTPSGPGEADGDRALITSLIFFIEKSTVEREGVTKGCVRGKTSSMKESVTLSLGHREH